MNPEQHGNIESASEVGRENWEDEWVRLITEDTTGVFAVMQRGEKLGVPEERRNEYARRKIEEAIEKGRPDYIARLMKSLGLGTDAERDEYVARAKQRQAEVEEQERAEAAERYRDWSLDSLPKDVTFGDLLGFLGSSPEVTEEYENRLYSGVNRGDAIVRMMHQIDQDPGSLVMPEKSVLDFFRENGYSEDELGLLPFGLK